MALFATGKKNEAKIRGVCGGHVLVQHMTIELSLLLAILSHPRSTDITYDMHTNELDMMSAV